MMRFILKALIRFYQYCISPLKPACCRFTPSCSEYALEAISMHGACKGSIMAFLRLIRCQPLCKGGYDPVPAVWPCPKPKSEMN